MSNVNKFVVCEIERTLDSVIPNLCDECYDEIQILVDVVVSDGFSWFLRLLVIWVWFCFEYVVGLFFYVRFCVIALCRVSWIYEYLSFSMYFSMYASARMTAIFS